LLGFGRIRRPNTVIDVAVAVIVERVTAFRRCADDRLTFGPAPDALLATLGTYSAHAGIARGAPIGTKNGPTADLESPNARHSNVGCFAHQAMNVVGFAARDLQEIH
jgi:hypothetical protein